MNVTLIIAILMVLVIVLATFQKRVPMYLVLMIVPIIAALCLGYSLTDISTSIMTKLNDTMASAGFLLLFALIYFNMMIETGAFETIVSALVKPFGSRMNVIILMVLTTALGLLCALAQQISVTYLVLFPVLLPLYKKLKLKPEYCFILVQTALAVMMWLPWSPGVLNVSVVLGCEPAELSAAASKAAICMAPGILFQWIYMAWRHKRDHGSLFLTVDGEKEAEAAEAKEESKKLTRPKLFWLNLLVFLLLMVGLLAFQLPAYLLFMIGSAYMILVNYPKDFGPLVEKAGKQFMGLFLFMVGISIYLAVFTDTGMVTVLGEAIAAYFPNFLARYMHVILLAVCVICIRYVPNRVFTMLYPVLVTVGAQFGFSGLAMIAPFIINLTLATGSTPLNPPNFLGCSLLEIDVDGYCNTAVKIQSVTNLIAIAAAIILGIMPI